MTIDEAISHALEVAERYERMEDSHDDKLKEECLQCAADHRQLAEWLTKLKELEAKHWDECRQIAHYDDEIKRQPLKHGRWISLDYDTYFECSECKHMTDWQLYKYCPYCGAKMIKDGDT